MSYRLVIAEKPSVARSIAGARLTVYAFRNIGNSRRSASPSAP